MGRNLVVEDRWALCEYDRLPTPAMEFGRSPVAEIASVSGERSALAAKAATRTIPVVAIFVADPVESGFVASLNRLKVDVAGLPMLGRHLFAHFQALKKGHSFLYGFLLIDRRAHRQLLH